nr:ABC transporter permease subunit [uncultured Butyricicoccus sp.]
MKQKNAIMGMAFFGSALVLLTLFLFLPLLLTLGFSFTDYFALNPDLTHFVGLENYFEIFKDELFVAAFFNTVKFVIIIVPLQCGGALLLALAINKAAHCKKYFKVAFFIPVVMSLAVVSTLWIQIYSPEGILNTMLSNFGIDTQAFIYSADQALPSIAIMSVWQGVGYQMIIFLGGLQNINPALYEAAEMDHATEWQKFRDITLPELKPLCVFVFITVTIGAFRMLVQPMVMTGGGPNHSTYTIVYNIYETGTVNWEMGLASTMAIVFTIFVVVLTIIQNVLTKDKEERHVNKKQKGLNWLLVAFLLILRVFFLFPVIWMLANSFKPDAAITADMNSVAAFIPPVPDGSFFDNYISILTDTNFVRYMANTLLYAAILIVLGIIVNGLAGYALAKINFPFRDQWLLVILMLLIVPTETVITIHFLFIAKLGLLDTVVGYILPMIVNPFNIFLFRQVFVSLPDDVYEAAQLDHCGPVKYFFTMVLPMSKTVVATVSVFTFLGVWNDYLWPSLVFTSSDLLTAQIGLNSITANDNTTMGQTLAVITLVTIPVIIIYALFSKQIVAGVMSTGSKEG